MSDQNGLIGSGPGTAGAFWFEYQATHEDALTANPPPHLGDLGCRSSRHAYGPQAVVGGLPRPRRPSPPQPEHWVGDWCAAIRANATGAHVTAEDLHSDTSKAQ